MRIKNVDVYMMIAELWNAEARATDAREQAWCVESVRAEVRASGMTPENALREAVTALCSHRLVAWPPRFCYEWDDDADDDDVVYEEDDDGDGDYVDEEDDNDALAAVAE